jgi:hypothetical protein
MDVVSNKMTYIYIVIVVMPAAGAESGCRPEGGGLSVAGPTFRYRAVGAQRLAHFFQLVRAEEFGMVGGIDHALAPLKVR